MRGMTHGITSQDLTSHLLNPTSTNVVEANARNIDGFEVGLFEETGDLMAQWSLQ